MSLPSVDEARARMIARVAPLPAETVAIDAASGRVLREAVRATRDQPPFAASAMDGWAVRSADADAASVSLRIVGESAAGRGWVGTLASGQAVRISTGAPMPDGADRVVMQEEAVRDGDHVRLGPVAGSSAFVRARGADFTSGDLLLSQGRRLDPWSLALCAAAGRETLPVSRRPRVAIVPTGDEVAQSGTAPGPWQIHDAAGAGLAAWFADRSCDVRRLSALRDDLPAVTAALRDIDCDLLVTIGGASVGDHDVVKPALVALGLELVVEGVAVRPGKPTWFGVLADGRRVLGLPGNPVSAMVCADLFGADVIAVMQGASPNDGIMRARLRSSLPANGPREHYMRAAIQIDENGGMVAEAASEQDSALVSVLAAASGLIRRLPGAPATGIGDLVEVRLLARAGAS